MEELPIKIRNPGLITALNYDLQSSVQYECDFDRLNLSTNPYLQKNLESLSFWVDKLAKEQNDFQYYTKRKLKEESDERRQRENPNEEHNHYNRQLNEPARIKSLLYTNQINEYCTQINKFTGNGFSKLFLAGSLHKETA